MNAVRKRSTRMYTPGRGKTMYTVDAGRALCGMSARGLVPSPWDGTRPPRFRLGVSRPMRNPGVKRLRAGGSHTSVSLLGSHRTVK